VSETITIHSHKGKYSVNFLNSSFDEFNSHFNPSNLYIVDQKVATLYSKKLSNILSSKRVLVIEATEENKSLDKFTQYIDFLIKAKVRRGENLVAIGGGIIQDITCFLASTLMRGLPWIFYPTTLLAQSDSCIGSKSSINSGDLKNILGTFNPPNKVLIDINFLSSLDEKDILSGVGEMLKVHAINSPNSFDKISSNYQKIKNDKDMLESFIYQSLLMKKTLIEIDEFDTGPRNVMNYGHSFGHAIESATNYKIPHGIAVTMGMDIANYVASELGVSKRKHFKRMHAVLFENSSLYHHVKIDIDLLMSALAKDKKNSSTKLKLILPDADGNISIGLYDNNENLRNIIADYFSEFRRGLN
tara:strand:- start:5988 stop:7064 length:1077 start_codon:yes stop_codon:yes gene_type:complete